jgi:hypothetical protein
MNPMLSAFDFFLGVWTGTGQGQPGVSTVERSYERVLNDRFLYVRNRSVYAPQAANPQGEVHEDWGFLSYDKARATVILRQFHGEGFVNQYALESITPDGQTLVLVTEQIENIAAGWRAKETYHLLGPDAFREVFELAAPGQDFAVYSESHLRRTT